MCNVDLEWTMTFQFAYEEMMYMLVQSLKGMKEVGSGIESLINLPVHVASYIHGTYLPPSSMQIIAFHEVMQSLPYSL